MVWSSRPGRPEPSMTRTCVSANVEPRGRTADWLPVRSTMTIARQRAINVRLVTLLLLCELRGVPQRHEDELTRRALPGGRTGQRAAAKHLRGGVIRKQRAILDRAKGVDPRAQTLVARDELHGLDGIAA